MASSDQQRSSASPAGGDEPAAEKSVLFLVPGLMASELEVAGRPVWIDPQALGQGDLERLDIRSARVQATAPLRYIYSSVEQHFANHYDVRPFAYDWRRSLGDAASQLALEIRAALEETGGPVKVLGHSTGGLVARAMAILEPETWALMVEHGESRMVLVGAPLGGTMLVPRILVGSATLVHALAQIDFQSDAREVVRILSDFPGILELLPEAPDFFSHDFWLSLPSTADHEDWIYPGSIGLARAREFRDTLAGSVTHSDRISYVSGRGLRTPTRMVTDDGEVVFEYSNRGDGVVLWKDSVPAGARSWFLDSADGTLSRTSHGRLLSAKDHFSALHDLLERGETTQLNTEPPVPEDAELLEVVPDAGTDRFPDWQYLASLAIGWPPAKPSKDAAPPLLAQVKHSDLAAAQYPVVVGHYAGDGIANAEAALDYRVGGRLSRLHQLALYPAERGSCEVVLVAPEESKRGRTESPAFYGAVVLGLGEVGSMSSRSLTAAVRQGVIRYTEALRTAGRTEAAGLSFLLMGTSDGSLSIEASIRACLRGVLNANEELEGLEMSPRLDTVEFVELYRDRALEALVALRSVAGDAEFAKDGKPLLLAQPLKQDATGQRRVSFEMADEWWARLNIELVDDTLRFTTPTSRARSEDSRVHIQADLIRRLLGQARERKAVDEETPGALFELLVSNELKAMIGDRGDLVLVLDDGAAQFPWELLIDRFRGSAQPMSIGSGLIRSLRVEITPPLDVARQINSVFVVGDPPSHWPALPGAQREARDVAARFEAAGWDVTAQIHPRDKVSAASVLRALMSDRYRILHLAGHGDFQPGKPTRTGMIIGSRRVRSTDDGDPSHELQLLRPHEVLQMPAVPELVFINCCHLGRQEGSGRYLQDRPLLASNLASQFIKNGVRAVVAAGWEVGDLSAKQFSERFYREMLEGNTFGDAVTEARQHVYSSRRMKDNTWGAFQCYGDPGYRLVLTENRGVAYRSRFLDTGQLLAELDNVISRSQVRTADSDARDKLLRGHLQEIEKRLRRDQRRDGAVLARLAHAWAKLGDRDNAIELYERARARASSGVTLTDLEQLANLRARRAAAPFVGGKKPRGEDRGGAAADIRRSIEELEHLLQVSETGERLSLLASTHKRLALATASSTERTAAIAKMTETYARAVPFSPDDPYPLINTLTGIVLMGGPWTSPPRVLRVSGLATPDGFDEALQRAESLAQALEEGTQTNFWDRIHMKDLKLARALAAGTLKDPAKVRTVATGYRALWHRLGAPGDLDSVLDQVGFIRMVIRGSRSKKVAHLKELLPGLDLLAAELTKPL